jgi:hypothetical protein
MSWSILDGVSWMECHGWSVLGYYRVSWTFLDSLLDIPGHYRTVSWTILDIIGQFPGVSWSVLDIPGKSWTFLDAVSWRFLARQVYIIV